MESSIKLAADIILVILYAHSINFSQFILISNILINIHEYKF